MATSTPLDPPKLEYKPLSENPRGAFSCGVSEIDKWYSRCWPKHASLSSRVVTFSYPGYTEIVGFYSLGIKLESEFLLTQEEKKTWRRRFNILDQKIVTVNFEYLAVEKAHQGKKIGTAATGRVINEFAHIARTCGIELMTGCAIDTDTFDFYRKLGFEKYGSNKYQPLMFFSAITAMKAIPPDLS